MRCIPTPETKKYCCIWVAVDRIGEKFIDCYLGSRKSEIGIKLWDNLKGIYIRKVMKVMTDYWKTYAEFVNYHLAK